jgi:hypothetical protein
MIIKVEFFCNLVEKEGKNENILLRIPCLKKKQTQEI